MPPQLPFQTEATPRNRSRARTGRPVRWVATGALLAGLSVHAYADAYLSGPEQPADAPATAGPVSGDPDPEPGIAASDIPDPDPGSAEANLPDLDPGMTESDPDPDIAGLDVAGPDIAGPDVAEPDVAEPDVAESDLPGLELADRFPLHPDAELDRIERQIEIRELAPAIHWLDAHIADIESTGHAFDPRLVRPLTLLGDAHSAAGDAAEALRHFQRALHLTRINSGLNALDQVEVVYREASALKTLGDFEAANHREEYAYHVLSRSHGPLDPALLPGLYHLAEWYQQVNNVFASRELYQRAAAILEANGGLEDPAAIPALHGIAMTYRLERYPPFVVADLQPAIPSPAVASSMMQPQIRVNNFPEGERALQQIVRIRQNQPADDPAPLARAVLDLADWYTLFDKPRRADPLYEHAWQILEAAGVDVSSYFADPELLYFPAPPPPAPPPPERRGEPARGYVELSYQISSSGQVRSLSTVASEPEGLMDIRVRRSMRVARYRPMLVDGVPVSKEQHIHRFEFPYYPERDTTDEDASRQQASTGMPPADSTGG